MEWFQIRRNHYTHDYLILLTKSILPLQRQTSTPPRSWRCKSLGGVQQNLRAMKQTISNSMNTLDRKANQKQDVKSKKAEAKARSRVNRNWEKVQNSQRYRSASAKVVCDTVTKKIEVEVLDGILLKLNIKSQLKPTSVQNRILRRIVEKRQAQANHKKHGRTEDLASIHVSITSTSRCMETIRKKRFAA